MRHVLLIDPGVHGVQLDAVNAISQILAEISTETLSPPAALYTVALEQGKRRLSDAVFLKSPRGPNGKLDCAMEKEKGCCIVACENVMRKPCEAISVSTISAIVSLGSEANVTENLPWMHALAEDLRPLLFDFKIPFYGSCFSHQLLAWMCGAKVDYLKERIVNPHLMHKGWRSMWIENPRVASFFGRAEYPCLVDVPVWHAQEVWSVPDGFEVSAHSEMCAIEGLAHKSLPIYSLQSHPEWFHQSGHGYAFLKGFLSQSLSQSLRGSLS